jgi:hypothetical protein
VHYRGGRLAGVIDFGLAHLDSRPCELAVARTWRAPEAVDAYRGELARNGWPLSTLEEAAIGPLYRAFRLGMAASELDDGLKTGDYDLAAICASCTPARLTAALTSHRLAAREAWPPA